MIRMLLLVMALVPVLSSWAQKKMAITIDDPTTKYRVLTWKHINSKMLHTLQHNKLQAALFVCGMRIDSDSGSRLLKEWDAAGHLICSHTYSHSNYSSERITAAAFIEDFLRGDRLIRPYRQYTRLFRYPYLKEGDTEEKIISMRNTLISRGYDMGYVSIDASDWYIDAQLTDTLSRNPKANIAPYRDYYIRHIIDRARYYDSLSQILYKEPLPHTLLIHHSLLNALFLDDLITALKGEGWELINAKEAYEQAPYRENWPPSGVAGESIVYQMARLQPMIEEKLRYPAEDAVYEEIPFSAFLRQYDYGKNQCFLDDE